MKTLIFDAGPVISLTMNNLLWILTELKKKQDVEFYITKAVKNEIVDFPLTTKKYKLEAIQVMELIDSGIIKIIDNDYIKNKTSEMLGIANGIFKAFDHYINILHYAEVSVISASNSIQSDAIVIDEKTTRLLVEEPAKLREILKKTLHTNIYTNVQNLNEFRKFASRVRIIRSVEVAAVAYELGILDKYITKTSNSREQLLDAMLWGIKLKGCSVSENEINKILKIELR